MQIIDNIIILALIVLSFVAGKRTSDRYNSYIVEDLEYQIRLMSAEKGIGYVPPPRKKYYPIGEDFMQRRKENGHATQLIRPTQT